MKALTSTHAPGLWLTGLVCIFALASPARAAVHSGRAGYDPGNVSELIAVLNRADAPVFEKARACQLLSLAGTAEAIDALRPLLDHPRLATYARTALEQIPDPAADKALRDALGSLQGTFLIGVVNSIGIRGDTEAVEPLTTLVRDPSKGAAAEALLALARIDSGKAIEVIRENLTSQTPELRAAAAEGCLIVAERAMARNQRERAIELDDLVRKADVPRPFQLAAIRGAILARGADGVPLLVEQLKSDDADRWDIAISTSRELNEPAVTRALADQLSASEPRLQVLLLQALADRADPAVSDKVEALVRSGTPEVRVASLATLRSVGGASSIPLLIRAVQANRSPAEVNAAAESLTRLGAEGVETALLDALGSAPSEARARLIEILGHRNAANAADALLRQAADPDPVVSRAAFDALASVAQSRDLPRVIRVALATTEPSVREKAERAIYATALKNPDPARRSEPLAKAFRDTADSADKRSLMEVLALLGDSTARRVIAVAAEDPDSSVRDAAIRLLSHWPDATATPVLLGIFRNTTNEVHRTEALRGVVNLATLFAEDPSRRGRKEPPAESVQWLSEANAAIRDQAEEKRIIVSGLGRLNSLAGLRLLGPYLDDAAVRREAGLAVLRLAAELDGEAEKRALKPLLEKIASFTDAELRQQAEEALKKYNG